MAELALVLPVFILLMVSLIEFGRAVMVQQVLVNAAREGARRAVVPGATNEDVAARVDQFLITLQVPGRATSITGPGGETVNVSTANRDDIVRVRVSVPYNQVGIRLTSFFTATTMSAVVQMRKE
jgi:Flp pilus assembly protein TadG